MALLSHVTLNSGERTMVRPRARDAEGLIEARRLMDLALAQGVAQLPPPRDTFGLHVERTGGAIMVTVLGLIPGGSEVEPLAVFGVAPRARDGRELWRRLLHLTGDDTPRYEPPAPWLGVVLMSGLESHLDAVHWLVPFEQDIAWAWIGR